jgi:hypothetical protein
VTCYVESILLIRVGVLTLAVAPHYVPTDSAAVIVEMVIQG